jgi:hypothetical protein
MDDGKFKKVAKALTDTKVSSGLFSPKVCSGF